VVTQELGQSPVSTLRAIFRACNLRVIDIQLSPFLLQPLHGPDLIFEEFPARNGGGAALPYRE
jgi:hypothetical protein